MSDYNGWSNKQTWCVGLWLMDWFRDIANEKEWDEESLAQALEDATWDHLSEVPEGGSLLLDMVTTYMHDVDWNELARAASED